MRLGGDKQELELEQAMVALEDAREEATAAIRERDALAAEGDRMKAALDRERQAGHEALARLGAGLQAAEARLAKREAAAAHIREDFVARIAELASHAARELTGEEQVQVFIEELQVAAEELAESNAMLAQAYGRLELRTAELEAANAALSEREARLRLAHEVTGVATWEWDPDTNEQFCTPARHALLGLDPMQGDHGWEGSTAELIHPDDRAEIEATLREAAASDRAFESVFRVRRKDRRGGWTTRWIIGRGSHLARADGKPGRMLGVALDITERRNAEARLQELQAQLLHGARLGAAGEMATMLAHELSQPLTAVTSCAEVALGLLRSAATGDGMADAACPAVALTALEDAVTQSMRATQIVRSLRRFVTRDEGERHPENLAGLLDEAIALALAGPQELGLSVSRRLAPTLAPVLVDRVQIQQVLVNLIRNAIEAIAGMANGPTPPKAVIVTAAQLGNREVEVAVADTGPGLAPEIADRLFNPFVTSKPDGMGVGLAICRTIVETHGGRLWAAPNPGGGMVFRFTLPVA